MELMLTMDKKIQSRPSSSLCKSSQDPSKPNFDSKKGGLQYPRKRENEKSDNGKRSSGNRGGRAGQRYVRPREKMGSQVGPNLNEGDFEIGSVQRSGGKKQNITHLMNWWSPGPERYTNHSFEARGGRSRKHVHHSKYNKEHYLQANCQFIVSAGQDYSVYENDPDQLVDWNFVEEVRLHVSESPACPICLYLPVAAKVTRCGHIFCFPCILHYLALTDEKWRKCPICFDPISKDDLKSSITILHKNFMRDEEIEFKLMRRERDSLVPIPVTIPVVCSNEIEEKPALLSRLQSLFTYSKLIVASKSEVSRVIVAREIEELTHQLDTDGDEPEACFINEALHLVAQREILLQEDTGTPTGTKVGPVGLLSSTGSLLDSLSLEELQLVDPFLDKKSRPKSQSRNLKAVAPDDFGKCAIQDSKGAQKPPIYFYQESSGAHTYLHFLNAQMLMREYGSLENCPLTIKAKVVEKESLSMSEHLRHRVRFLGHLPLSCTCEIVEIDVKPPLVSVFTLSEFQGQLEQRERKRKKRIKEETRIEKRVQVEEDRMMGRNTRCAKINMSSFRHFPSFAGDVRSLDVPYATNAQHQVLQTTSQPPQAVAQASQSSVEIPIQTPEHNIGVSSSVGSTSGEQNTSDEYPGMSPPSFAQMIRCGQKKPSKERDCAEQFPALGTSAFGNRVNISRNAGTGNRRTTSASSDEDDERERVPDYSAAFFDDFDKALEQAKKKAAESADSPGAKASQRGGKGKKKKKGIVLLSSGGR